MVSSTLDVVHRGAMALLVMAVVTASLGLAAGTPAGAATGGPRVAGLGPGPGSLPDVSPIVAGDPLPNAGPLSPPVEPDTPDAAPTPLDLALEEARETGVRVEVPSLRRGRVVVFANPTGSFTEETAATAGSPGSSREVVVTPDVPSGLHPVDEAVVATLQPTLRATVTAPGYAGSIVTRFEVLDDAQARVSAHDVLVTPGAQASWTVPARVLRPGRAYTWKVTACTGFLPQACSEPAVRSLTVESGLAVGSRGFFTYDTTSISDRSGLAVNVASGNVSVTVADLALAGAHGPLSMTRAYNSLSAEDRDLGRGWSGAWSATVRLVDEPGGSKVFMGESGEAVRIKRNGDGTYTPSGDLDARFIDAGGFGVYVLEFNHDRGMHRAGDRLDFFNSGPNRNRLRGSRGRNGAETLVAWSGDRVASVTDTVGRVVAYGHDEAGRITSRSVGDHKVSYGYSPAGELTSVTDAEGNVTTYGYTGNLLTRIASPGGSVIDIGYDTRGRALSVARTVAGVAEASKYSYVDTAVNGLFRSAVTDARGHVSTYLADHANRVAKAFDAAGKAVARSYDDNSNVTEVVDANQTFTYAYSSDNRNNLEKVTAPMGATSTASYDQAATKGMAPYLARSATDPQGNTTSFGHDGFGNLLRTQNALAVQNSSRVERHGVGGVSCPTARKGQVCASFDARGIATRYRYDASGQVAKVDQPAPLGDVTVTHDSLGRVATVTDGKAQTRTFTYDRLDRLTTAAYGSKTISYGYDPAGNTTDRVDAAGAWAMAYDEANRLRRIDGPDAPPGYPKDLNDIAFAYDPVGNLTSLTDIGGTTRYTFTNVNMTDTITDPDGGVTHYRYDDANHATWLTSITHPNGSSSTLSQDGNGRVNKVVNRAAGGTVLTDVAYEFTKNAHDATLLSKVTTQGGTTSYGYDAANRLTEVTDTPNGTGPLPAPSTSPTATTTPMSSPARTWPMTATGTWWPVAATGTASRCSTTWTKPPPSPPRAAPPGPRSSPVNCSPSGSPTPRPALPPRHRWGSPPPPNPASSPPSCATPKAEWCR
ncbi:MAG: repeat protein [Acidimicrobiales bacterium]|nr:repeat protein [Acidimicrobiales bacterium]